MKTIRLFGLAGLAATLLVQHIGAQQPASFEVPDSGDAFSVQDMRTLVGPIALYADDLVGIILPASTYPLQIVQASRFLDEFETDNSLQPDPDWDDAVVALLNYPEILRMMDQNIEWTWALGEAVLDEQPAVLDAIQGFRRDALAAGNLVSDEQQRVTDNDGTIEIAPADPEVIYIPYYEPERVVVVQPRPVIRYYTRAYPLYYYPYPYGYSFHASYFWGVTTAFSIGWHSHILHIYDHHHHSHPYYGRVYYSPWYPRYNVNINVYRRHDVWQPQPRRAARPRRIDSGVRSVASRERQSAPRSSTRSSSLVSDQRRTNTRTNSRIVRTPATAAESRVRDRSRTATGAQTNARTTRAPALTPSRALENARGAGNQAPGARDGQVSRQRLSVAPRSNAARANAAQGRQERSGSTPRYGSGSQGAQRRYGTTTRPPQPLGSASSRATRQSAAPTARPSAGQQRSLGAVRPSASRSAAGAGTRAQAPRRSSGRVNSSGGSRHGRAPR